MIDITGWISKRRYGKKEENRKMRSLWEIKAILIGSFYGVVFIDQVVIWTIINHIGSFDKSIRCILGTAVSMTVITCSMYLILHKLYQKFRGYEETTLEEDIYETFRTH